MLTLYHFLALLLTPFLPLWLRWREAQGKEDPSRRRERFGEASLPRPKGRIVWIHAASMGESQSVLPLIHRLIERHERLQILVTTGTLTSARNIAPKLPERAYHQFVPLDSPVAVRRFLAYWRPSLAFWVESEFWPSLMLATKRYCPMILLNGRISARSAERWHQFPEVIRRLLGCFSLILAKSEEDAARLRNLGALLVQVEGNLKFSAPALEADPKTTSEILSRVGERPLWLAASTHPGEEVMIGEAHRQVVETHPGLLTVIVPRHASRGEEVAAALTAQGLRVARRSLQQDIAADTDVYLADTMGELGIFYRLAGIVFIGGSLVPHGGQNPFEPARLDCAILYGPHMHNFTEFCHELEAAGGAVKIADTAQLAATISLLLRDHAQEERIAKAAREAVKKQQDVIERVLVTVEPYIQAALAPRAGSASPAAPAPAAGEPG